MLPANAFPAPPTTKLEADLVVPTDVRINVALYRPYVSLSARKLEEAEMRREVAAAVQRWHYEEYC